jgi:pimeloyl-ACP methyl ester carboxylesterase
MEESFEIPGRLITLPLSGRRRPLDGFWARGAKPGRALLVFVHGMHSNFYRSTLKKTLMREGPKTGLDVLSFNNRGAEQDTADERFSDCLADLDAAVRFGRRHGYRRFVLVGHSTGCQKITYYQAVRRDPAVAGLVLLAIGDDYAIARRDLGRRFAPWVRRARALVARGKGRIRLPRACQEFSARRFLSVADPAAIEAGLFNFEGNLSRFRRIRCPVLAIFAGDDEYETLPPARAAEILRRTTRTVRFESRIRRGADHGFRGDEEAVVRLVCRWARKSVAPA